MDPNLKVGIWRQFCAVIDYLEHTVTACPDRLWHHPMWDTRDMPPVRSQVWYVAYHTLFWLDLYLTGSEDGFVPPAPFALIEQDDDGPLPERAYRKDELLGYLRDCRQRCKQTIQALTDADIHCRCWFPWGEPTYVELLIYNLRHVQEHAGQINLTLGQHGVATADYPTWCSDDLD